MGLVKAAEKWKPSRGRFSIWCRKWVRGQITKETKVRLPAVTGIDLSKVPDHRLPPVPELVPLFPIVPYDPGLTAPRDCPHRGQLRDSIFICAVCWQASPWIENHPDMQVSIRDRSRRRRFAAVIPMPVLNETRRDRRRRLFGTRKAAAHG